MPCKSRRCLRFYSADAARNGTQIPSGVELLDAMISYPILMNRTDFRHAQGGAPVRLLRGRKEDGERVVVRVGTA
jgi:hypothetical protein